MMVLSDEAVLVYILAETGVRGRLTAGRIERTTSGTLDVFDARGMWFEYLSQRRLRSWCVVGSDGAPIDGWREILPEDLPRILAV
jgi:hypothetical protein